MRNLINKRFFLKWYFLNKILCGKLNYYREIGFTKYMKELQANQCPFLIPNSGFHIYFDRNSKDLDQIVKCLNIVSFSMKIK